MSSSGLIYAVIVGLWAAYLVPMWLRRQDELAESGSQDRLFTAVRVLTRRPSLSPVQETEAATQPTPRTPKSSGSGSRPSRRRARLLARRRRVISVLFLTFTAGSALTAWFGMAFVGLPGVTGLLLSLYIAHLRAQERRRAEVKDRRRRRAAIAARNGRDLSDMPGGAGGGSLPPEGHPHDPDAWEPVPVPLPTYVTAPVAADGTMWTHGPLDAASQPAQPPGPAVEGTRPAVYDQYSDLKDRPRAVND